MLVTIGEKLTDSAYIALAFRILKVIRLYPNDEQLIVLDEEKKEKILTFEETIDLFFHILYSGLCNSKLYAG